MKLFVIGNGFDLHHHIKSSYKNFAEYLFVNDIALHNTLQLFNLHGEELWADFEANLAELDEDVLYQYYSDSLVSYGDDNWSDRYHHEFQFFIEEEVWRMTYGLKKSFLNWILCLTVDNGCRFEGIAKLFELNADKIFLNFNYTDSLECKYGVDRERILYIHNKAEDEKSNLILGHSVLGKQSDKELWSGDVRMSEAELHIMDYYKKTCKASPQVINDNSTFFQNLYSVDEIYVLGHSMSWVDKLYFETILRYIDMHKVIWNVSYYDGFEKVKHYNSLTLLGVGENFINQFRLDSLG